MTELKILEEPLTDYANVSLALALLSRSRSGRQAVKAIPRESERAREMVVDVE